MCESNAATLCWEPNPPSDNIAFYTVYAESITGTLQWNSGTETCFELNELLASVTYLLTVSATSVEGLESERSSPISYRVPDLLGLTITSQPSSTNLAVGKPLTLSVAASSLWPVSYQWRKDGQPIPGQVSNTLIISATSSSDSGKYTVLLSNQVGITESAVSWVTVQDAPRVITQPKSVVAGAGTGASLYVEATGTDLQYQWYKNSVPLPGEMNATLSFASVSIQDKGAYHVTVTNLVGSVTSESATIAVNVLPVVIQTPPAGTNLTTGGTILLQVEVTGSPPFSFEWIKDGVDLPSAYGDTLVISSASLADSGEYRVRISNSQNWVTSAIAKVLVTQPPAVGASLSLDLAPDGSFRVSALANPNTNYEVQRSDSLIVPNWTKVQDITANSAGFFQVTIGTDSPVGFIRTVRR